MRQLFEYNSIAKMAGNIGSGKTSIPESVIKRASCNIFYEMRDEPKIRGFPFDDLALELLYSDPAAFFSLFNIYKPDCQTEQYCSILKSQRQGGKDAIKTGYLDRTIHENL